MDVSEVTGTSHGSLDGEAVAAGWARHFQPGIPVCERCQETSDAAVCCDGCGEALCRRCWGDGDLRFCAACWHRRQPAFVDVIVTGGVL